MQAQSAVHAQGACHPGRRSCGKASSRTWSGGKPAANHQPQHATGSAGTDAHCLLAASCYRLTAATRSSSTQTHRCNKKHHTHRLTADGQHASPLPHWGRKSRPPPSAPHSPAAPRWRCRCAACCRDGIEREHVPSQERSKSRQSSAQVALPLRSMLQGRR